VKQKKTTTKAVNFLIENQLNKRLSVLKRKTKSEMMRVNSLNHSAAILAQITAQINSKNVNYEISQFLPYSMANTKILSLDVSVMLTFLSTINNLDMSLHAIAADSKIQGRVAASYYWKSHGYIYC
jgi:glycine cleavage system regulatory protein